MARARWLMESLLFEVSPTDPTTFASVGLLTLLSAAAACLAPALRIVGIDPSVALQAD